MNIKITYRKNLYPKIYACIQILQNQNTTVPTHLSFYVEEAQHFCQVTVLLEPCFTIYTILHVTILQYDT